MLLDLKNIFKKYKVNAKGVLHIGAHWGQEDSLYEDLNISERIYFEPLQKNYSVLRNKIDSKYKCIRTALGNITGDVEMNVEDANNGMSSSVLMPEMHLLQYPHIKFQTKELVPITKLDLIEFNRLNFNFINIDVQGYELEVFKGAIKTLEHIEYIVSEVNRAEVYTGCAKVDELDFYLEKFKFKRLETDWAGRTWGDAFYAKI